MNEEKLIVETRQLCKNFGPTVALNHVDLKVYRGQITGLIGENGSGKSTITSILAGMQPATSGEIYYKGQLHKPATMIEGASMGIGMIGLAQLLAEPLSGIFVGYDPALQEMTTRGFRIYILSFLLCGFNIYGSSFFTALNNGLISALISFLRTLAFQIGTVLLLPLIFGLDGIWWSVVAAELGSLALTAFFLVKYRRRYHYA